MKLRYVAVGVETFLVFDARPPMITSMDKPWYRKLFSHSQTPVTETATLTTDYENADVQFSMGFMFASSVGVAQDYAQAAEWYRKAADQSHALAQFNLAMMYLEGQGVEQDAAEAEIWFQKAAQQGDAGAQFNLGMSHRRASLERKPTNAVESRIEAYKWFQLAAAQGYKGSAAAYEQVNLNMSRADVEEGNQRAATILAAIRPAAAAA